MFVEDDDDPHTPATRANTPTVSASNERGYRSGMGRTPSIVRAETLCPAAEGYEDEIGAAPAGAILTDELVHRVERTLAHDAATVVATMRAIDPTSHASVVPRAGGVLAHTGPGLPINRAIGMGLDLAVDASDLDAVVDFFDKRRMPAEIELCPFADDGLRARASERGFSVAWFRSVFTRSIAKIEPAPKFATTFERVDDRATFVTVTEHTPPRRCARSRVRSRDHDGDAGELGGAQRRTRRLHAALHVGVPPPPALTGYRCRVRASGTAPAVRRTFAADAGTDQPCAKPIRIGARRSGRPANGEWSVGSTTVSVHRRARSAWSDAGTPRSFSHST